MAASAGPEVERLIQLLSKLPGFGPRSARRAALHLLTHRDVVMRPLADALTAAADRVIACAECRNLDTATPCHICADGRRDQTTLCVVEQVADLWALERAAAWKGRYHVLGGVLSAMDGVGPEELAIPALAERVRGGSIAEVVLALNATVEGQTTAHYIAERLAETGARVTFLAQGVPIGGELDHLDDGTIAAALAARRTQ